MDNLVTQLHHALIEALQTRRSFVPDHPVTVAEIYQDLIPYRSVRSALGFALNADYEHTLLQLLAGTDDLARIEPPEVREALVNELASPNPNVGVFHNYAACDVFVAVPKGTRDRWTHDTTRAQQESPARTNPENGKATPEARRDAESHPRDNPSWEAVFGTPAELDEAAAVRAFAAARDASPQPPTASIQGSTKACASCQATLPAGREIQFCPFCGRDQSRRQCPKCETTIDKGWRFCITCGTAVS
jgi:hypothetical protein